MMGFEEARNTLTNNLNATLNLIWAVLKHAPDCHIIKLGTMGEYGTPNIDIEEGWIDIEHKGRKEKFLYPRQGGSLYHTTKIMDTDMLWFYVRIYGLAVTDLMQGPVYGLSTDEADLHPMLVPNFHYDDIFGTVVNRFLVQAVAGIPLTVYGKGGQTRGYLNLRDTLQCIALAAAHPPKKGELRILNQFTETFSINELADAGATRRDRHGSQGRDPGTRQSAQGAGASLLQSGASRLARSRAQAAFHDRRGGRRDDRTGAGASRANRLERILPRVRWKQGAG